jgi:hypothetical protein
MNWLWYTAAALLGSILLALVSTWLLWKLEETGDEWILDAEDREKFPEDWDVWR